MRYAVDPAELQTAAGHAGLAGSAAMRAREQVLRAGADLAAWCPLEVRRYVAEACDALAFAALVAQAGSMRTASRLVHAAEGYRVADGQVAR